MLASSREAIEPASNALEAHAASAFARYASTDAAIAGVKAAPKPQRAASEVAALNAHCPEMFGSLKAHAKLSYPRQYSSNTSSGLNLSASESELRRAISLRTWS